MRKSINVFILSSLISWAVSAQDIITPNIEEIPEEFENIYKKEFYSDSLSSSFLIAIRKSVAAHKHKYHTEHIYVLEGSGDMTLGDVHISITKGDLLVIPKNTLHSVDVTSRDPLKIISIQSPKYTGEDQIYLE